MWTLLPPPAAVYTRRHATVDAELLPEEAARANQTVLHCIQRSGDMMYVPHGWGHGVLNLETSVGWATSFNGQVRAEAPAWDTTHPLQPLATW